MGTRGPSGSGERTTALPMAWPSRATKRSGVLAGTSRAHRSWPRGRPRGGAVARWGRGPRPALGCLDVAPLGRAAAAPRAPLALGAPASARPHGAAGVRGVGPAWDRAGNHRAGRGQPLDRGPVCGSSQRRRRPGAVERTAVDGRVSASHVGDGGGGAVDGTPRPLPARSTTGKKHLAGRSAEPSARRQDLAWAGGPLSMRARRPLCWRLGRARQQGVERMLAWSTWRRWQHGIAKDWPDQRRAVAEVQL